LARAIVSLVRGARSGAGQGNRGFAAVRGQAQTGDRGSGRSGGNAVPGGRLS